MEARGSNLGRFYCSESHHGNHVHKTVTLSFAILKKNPIFYFFICALWQLESSDFGSVILQSMLRLGRNLEHASNSIIFRCLVVSTACPGLSPRI